MAAEGGVLEEPRDELVVLDLADVLLLEGALAHARPELPAAAAGHAVGLAVVGVGRVVVLRHGYGSPLIGRCHGRCRGWPPAVWQEVEEGPVAADARVTVGGVVAQHVGSLNNIQIC